MKKPKTCNHERIYACRAETEDVVSSFCLVCAKCEMVRKHSHILLGIFHPWIEQSSDWYPDGARLTILAGPGRNESGLKEAAVDSIQQLAAKEEGASS